VVTPTSNVSSTGGLYGLIEPGSYWTGLEKADDPVSSSNTFSRTFLMISLQSIRYCE